MEALEKVILFTHLFGFAAVAGGLLSQLRSEKRHISVLILLGARWQLISGLLLFGIEHASIRHPVAGAKVLLALIILALCEMKRKKELTSRIYWVLLICATMISVLALFVTRSS